MRAMFLDRQRSPLICREVKTPEPSGGQLLVAVEACAVCRTDLHILDGELTDPRLPLVPGHEIVGRVVAAGEGVDVARIGKRVGIPWLGHTCGTCEFCQSGRENLCDNPGFTGYTRDGGYASHVVADADFCFEMGEDGDAASLAPLLCAGLIGWRSLKMAGPAREIGIYGFGAAAHIICQVAVYQKRNVYAFTSPGDAAAQAFARSLGAVWAGGSPDVPPVILDAAIIFAPVGALVVEALKHVKKGGKVVCGGIHMSDIPSFPYDLLWGEREILSVANLTRQDAVEFLPLATLAGVKTHIRTYPLDRANEAVADLRAGRLSGAAVLVP